jgi:Ca2+-binding EF-hand superfamily protein
MQVSNFEERRCNIRKVFRDHDDDHNNLLSAKEFYDAMQTGNFNLNKEDAEELVNYFFGEDIHSHSDDDEMKFSDFAKKVQALSMLPRMRGEI